MVEKMKKSIGRRNKCDLYMRKGAAESVCLDYLLDVMDIVIQIAYIMQIKSEEWTSDLNISYSDMTVHYLEAMYQTRREVPVLLGLKMSLYVNDWLIEHTHDVLRTLSLTLSRKNDIVYQLNQTISGIEHELQDAHAVYAETRCDLLKWKMSDLRQSAMALTIKKQLVQENLSAHEIPQAISLFYSCRTTIHIQV